ncbi:protein phosphatase 2C domain-containing protein [Streptomyces sp. NPDC048506]|uniref:protein phosphatase 2C domain-containing protein n=1 Tax=Streptomyces sp. NPDC048506 TaxID=3155028 RepID=UPI003429F922
MGVTGPSRCTGCGEPLGAGDKFCGRCGAASLTPGYAVSPAYGAAAAPPVPPLPPRPPVPPAPPAPPAMPAAAPPAAAAAVRPAGPVGPVGPPPPDPGTRLPDGDDIAPPVPGGAPAAPSGPAAADGAQPPADPRVAGYEVVADAAAEAAARSAAEPAEPVAAAEATDASVEDSAVCAVCRSGAVDVDGHCERCGHARPRQRDHMERELAGMAAVSDRGHRHHRNEDFFALRATALPDGSPAVIAVVCDGVSSATRPDDASKAASEAAGEALRAELPRGTHPQQAMHQAVLAASAAVDALAADPALAHHEQQQQNAPACTFVGAVVGGGLLTIGWVGDSRAYWIPDDRTAPPVRLTEDDSWAAQMVANNLMSEEEANADERAHAITGWLGADAYEVEPHTAAFKPDGPGIVVVCTDGLWNYAETAQQMAAVLPHDAPGRPLDGARTLVTHALDGGGHDNVTVALVPFPAPPAGAGSA